MDGPDGDQNIGLAQDLTRRFRLEPASGGGIQEVVCGSSFQ